MGNKHRPTFHETLDPETLDRMTDYEYDLCVRRLDQLLSSRSGRCPCCGSSDIIRKGRSPNGSQRYACKICGKGFIANAVPYSHMSIDKWKLFYRSYMKGESIHRCAMVCDICLKTSQYMKDRLVDMVRNDPSMPVTFRGEMMMDARKYSFILNNRSNTRFWHMTHMDETSEDI